LHLKLEARHRARVDLFLYSELEGRVPKGGHKAFFEARIEEFFSREWLDIGFGHKVTGSPEALAALKILLEIQS
jgi:hypothetical protein